MTTTKTFAPEEADAILEKLDSGAALTHELAEEYECGPADIWRLWDERNRAR